MEGQATLTLDQYQQLAARTAKPLPTLGEDLVHASLGITTENGEFSDVVKRHVIYGKDLGPVEAENLGEELGDILWYVSLAATKLNLSLGDIAKANVAKLSKRYPEKYTDQDALARADKAGEA